MTESDKDIGELPLNNSPLKPEGKRQWWKSAEDLLICIALAALVLLPISNIVFRRFDWGIPGADKLITHLTLVIAILGGALAARQRKLLSLSTAESLMRGWAKAFVTVISSGVGGAVTLYLGLASFIFVSAEMEFPKDFNLLGAIIPEWCIQALMPLGFLVIALRIIWKSSEKWRWRSLTALITLLVFGVFTVFSYMPSLYVSTEKVPESVKIFVRERVVARDLVYDVAYDKEIKTRGGEETVEEQDRLAAEKAAKGQVHLAAEKAWVVFETEDECYDYLESIVVYELIFLALVTVIGLPIFAMLGGAAVILFASGGEPIAAVSSSHYSMSTDAMLPAIPLFTLAGYLLAESHASKRLVRLFQALFGSLRGGPAVVTVAACAFFTSFTGASGVTILALGALLMPVLLDSGYKERTALGLLTGSGSLGMLFPPCLPVILYAIRAKQEISQMFLGGLLPGLLLLAMTGAYGVWRAKSSESVKDSGWRLPGIMLSMVGEVTIPIFFVLHRYLHSWEGDAAVAAIRDTIVFAVVVDIILYRVCYQRLLCSLKRHGVVTDALEAVHGVRWEIRIPVVALIGLFGGLATAVEAAAVTALYTFVVEVVIKRDLKITKDVPSVFAKCGLLVGGVFLILGVAMGFTNYLITAQIPDTVVAVVREHIHSKYVFLLCLNLMLIVVGCLMDVFSAIIVMVPLLAPLGAEFGIDPIHLGIIFLANLELGFITPPIGMNLFLASYRFDKPILEICRSILPILLVQLIAVLLITYLPPLTTWLPELLG